MAICGGEIVICVRITVGRRVFCVVDLRSPGVVVCNSCSGSGRSAVITVERGREGGGHFVNRPRLQPSGVCLLKKKVHGG